MQRRIMGLETEFGITCASEGKRRLTPDEAARYLFRSVVSWGRSSNVFLPNGSRLYLDVGSHPEYATAECDDVRQVVVHDRAGERILERLTAEAQARLADDDIDGDIYLFKNNVDSAGNSYGCHENYCLTREGDFQQLSDRLLPFLISRQITCGAGRVVTTTQGARYAVSQRADHIWEGVSSATTRSRPIINTRDEPHADAERYRRLHVIVGDSNMSETTTLLKVGSAHLVLQMIEAGVVLPELDLESPTRAIRELSGDPRDGATVRLAAGGTITGLAIQQEYLAKAATFAQQEGLDDDTTRLVLDLWERTLRAIETDDLALVETEIDWVIKRRLLDAYAARAGLDLASPRIAQLDLAYHDISSSRGLFRLLERRGQAARLTTDEEVEEATSTAPQTTRARLRGAFITTALEHGRDYTVDWVHLKLNDQAQRTVLIKDPFATQDERVQRLIDGILDRAAADPPPPAPAP
ncbi:MAG: Pup--protein ligase [Micrococcales bacterium]|nr:Pup--protein ligase [Micrococcales bacterium]